MDRLDHPAVSNLRELSRRSPHSERPAVRIFREWQKTRLPTIAQSQKSPSWHSAWFNVIRCTGANDPSIPPPPLSLPPADVFAPPFLRSALLLGSFSLPLLREGRARGQGAALRRTRTLWASNYSPERIRRVETVILIRSLVAGSDCCPMKL